jgi:biopolymer transport protein ExbD
MKRRDPERAPIEVNLTSLIDVTFLLIVFFVLVSRLNEIENIELDLPSPADALTEVLESERQVVISVLPGLGSPQDDRIAGYRVGVADFPADAAGLNALTAHLARLYAMHPRLDVNIRADRSTHYQHVEPALQAVAAAARASAASAGGRSVARVNLAVLRSGS